MKRVILFATLLLGGCETIRPLVEVSHVSHAIQHVDQDVSNARCVPKCGYNVFSAGVRVRPGYRWYAMRGVTIDLLEGYSKDELHGQKEIFTGRLTWEIGAHDRYQ